MAYNEFILEPLNGVDEWSNIAAWAEYGPGLVLPIVGIPITITIDFPVALPSGQGSAQVFIREYASIDDPPDTPGFNTLCQVTPDFNWTMPPITLEVSALPTLPNLRFYFYSPVALNWGQVLGKASYSDILSKEAYEHVKESRDKLDKKLARIGNQKTKLQEMMVKGDADEAEVISALTLYTNFLSNDIALYEALNP